MLLVQQYADQSVVLEVSGYNEKGVTEPVTITLDNVRITEAQTFSTTNNAHVYNNGKKLHYIVGHSVGDIVVLTLYSKVKYEGATYTVNGIIRRRKKGFEMIQVLLT